LIDVFAIGVCSELETSQPLQELFQEKLEEYNNLEGQILSSTLSAKKRYAKLFHSLTSKILDIEDEPQLRLVLPVPPKIEDINEFIKKIKVFQEDIKQLISEIGQNDLPKDMSLLKNTETEKNTNPKGEVQKPISEIGPNDHPKDMSLLKKTETVQNTNPKFGKTKTETIQAFYDD